MHELVRALVFVLLSYSKICRAAPSGLIKGSDHESVLEVPYGKTAVLSCTSNDEKHLFLYWEVAKNVIVGPDNSYDEAKYKYEVLSGDLTVKHVSTGEEGLYRCVSRGVIDDNINIRSVRMIIKKDWEDLYEHDSTLNFFRVVILIGFVFIVFGGSYLLYRKWKGQHRLQSILEEDEEDSTEEIFSAPSTSKGTTGNIILEKGSERLLDDFDNSLSTEFNSILNQNQ